MRDLTAVPTVKPKALEFFAGIGLARLGLEQAGFEVAWANDYEPDKKAMYEGNFQDAKAGRDHKFTLGDIGVVQADELPSEASLAWASSPCTDLSLAGGRAGLAGSQSGTFWHFIRLLKELDEKRPEVAVLENVNGLATSHGGDDLTAAIRAFNELGYSVDVIALDARRFIPQSRPRMFLIAAQNPPADSADPSVLRPEWLQPFFSDPTLITHRARLPAPPEPLTTGLGDMIEKMSTDDERWWDEDRTARFVSSLSPVQADRVDILRHSGATKYRTAYRRTRRGVPVWEVRPDDISGCLRTARGGSSKQAVVQLGNGSLRVRWMSPREYARLMGAPDYNLDAARTNQALFGFGDAVAVPAVAWLGRNYLAPLINGRFEATKETKLRIACV